MDWDELMFQAAAHANVSEDRFWVLTPAELHIAARAAEHQRLTQAWIAESLRRAKVLKSLSSYLPAAPQHTSQEDLLRHQQDHERLSKEMN